MLTAVVSGLFQLAVLMVPAYRTQLAAWVGEVAGQPVEIGGILLRWRGLSPQVELSDIVLREESGAEFRVDRLRLGFTPWQLLQAEWVPRRILLSGLQLTVDIDEEGRVRVAGLGRGEPGRVSGWRRGLSRFPNCVLEDASIRVRWARGPEQPLQIAVDEALLTETEVGFDLSVDGQLPFGWGGRIQGSARVAGASEDLDGWSGDWFVLLADLSPQDIWPAVWRDGARFAPEALTVSASGRFDAGRLAEAHLNAAARRLQGDLLGEALPPLESPRLSLRWTRGDGSTSPAANEPLIAALPASLSPGPSPNGSSGGGEDSNPDLPPIANLLPHLTADETLPGAEAWTAVVEEASANGQTYGPLTLSRQGSQVQMTLQDGAFQPWAAWLALVESTWAPSAASLQGRVKDLRLTREAGRPGLHGEITLQDFGVRHQGTTLAGLDARLVFDGQSGVFSPSGEGWTLESPDLFEVPLSWEQFSGDWSWAPAAEPDGGWQLRAPALRVALPGARVEGAVGLVLPAAQGERWPSPRLALDLRLDVPDVVALKPYRPLHWGEPLRRWLNRAVQAGQVEGGRLQINGPLADFPFGARPTGEWRLDLPLQGLDLAYGPDWPALTDAALDLGFTGAGLTATVRSGSSSGLQVLQAEARIPELQAAELSLSAAIEGDLADYYRFLRASPLRRNLAGLLERSEASGPAALALDLEIPLNATRNTEAAGTLSLRDGRLDLRGLDGPVESVQGELRFDNRTLRAEPLTARWQGLDLLAAIVPEADQPGRLLVGAQLSPSQDAAAAFLPTWLRERLPGRSDWQLELGLGPGELPRLSSDLVGLAIDLPTPLGKTAAQPARFSVELPGPERPRLTFGFDDQRLSGRLYSGEDGRPIGLDLQLGGVLPPPRAEGTGLAIEGRLVQVEVADWLALLPGSSGEGGWPLQKMDLAVDQLHSGGYRLQDQRIEAERIVEGWLLRLSGAARGQLRWAGDGGLLSGALESVDLLFESPDGPPQPLAPRPVEVDPRGWPAVRLDLLALNLNGYPLGRGRLRSTPEADGYRLEELLIGERSLEIAMQGRWWLSEEGRRAALGFRVSSTDAESTLQAFGYLPNVSAEEAELRGEFDWPADAMLHWTQARGQLDLQAERGTLRAVNPGAGRVLGLVNFYALPRRLALDFRDLTDAGMRFDRIAGRFEVNKGIARTDDLALAGPSLRLQIDGEVDLANRLLDQRVTVLPGMSGGITLGATLLGGPAVGALALIAQELLQKPLDQITQFRYQVRGPWGQPEVTPLDDESLPTPPTTGAPMPLPPPGVPRPLPTRLPLAEPEASPTAAPPEAPTTTPPTTPTPTPMATPTVAPTATPTTAPPQAPLVDPAETPSFSL